MNDQCTPLAAASSGEPAGVLMPAHPTVTIISTTEESDHEHATRSDA
jgi:hypothetical protein